MSYCRFSCNKLPPDAHVYYAGDSFTAISIAHNRVIFQAHLPRNGQSFAEHTLEEGLNKLLYLRELGYHVPQHAIDGLRQEIEEERVWGSE